MTLEKRIRTCKNLTPTEQSIAAYILENPEHVLSLSIQDLENTLFLSKSAIHRFCKKIGCKGFNDLKVQLSQDSAEQNKDLKYIDVNMPFFAGDTPSDIAAKLQNLYQNTVSDTRECLDFNELSKAARLLFHADAIEVYANAHNVNIAENFQDKMLSIGKSVSCPSSFYKQRLTALAAHSDHAAILLSYSGKASFVLPLLKQLDKQNVPAILISRIGCNFYPQYVRHHIALSDNEQLRERISQFSSHIAMQYCMDVLFGCIYNLNRSANRQYLADSIEFMDDRNL